MTRVFEAALEFHLFLTERNIPYVIIGGIAVQHWSRPRLTNDVDITILIPIEETDHYIALLSSEFESRISDVAEMAKKNRILLLRAKNGCEVDIALGLPGYEEELIARAMPFKLDSDKNIIICSAEDLIIHKAAAGRPQDLADIKGIINRNGKKLDVEYIRSWLKNFSLLLETDDVINRFEKPFTEWQEWVTKYRT